MKHLLLLVLLLLLLRGHALEIRRPMWQVLTPMTWNDARDHCRSKPGGDLLTAVSQGELEQMDLSSYHAWVGLYEHNGHYHWDGAGPNYMLDDNHAREGWMPKEKGDGSDKCVLASYRTDKTLSASCKEKHFFYCSSLISGFPFDVFVPEAKYKSEAQQFCIDRGMSLSTFPYTESPRWPGSPFYVAREFPVWIDLQHSGSWSWSDSQAAFTNWAPDLDKAPSSALGPGPGSGKCVAVSSQSKSMSVQSCSKAFPFLCYKHNVVLVQELLNWEQALETCRNLMPSSDSFNLLRLQQSEMQNIKNVLRFSTTSKVWVGLRFLGGSWFWSDGGAVSQSSLPECPESGLHCGALVFNKTSGSDPPIELSDCSLTLNVLCYREP